MQEMGHHSGLPRLQQGNWADAARRGIEPWGKSPARPWGRVRVQGTAPRHGWAERRWGWGAKWAEP